MKKKYFSVALFSALLLSTPVFTGCADYDDDINNLQGQINGINQKLTVEDVQKAINDALSVLKSELQVEIAGKADNAAVIALQEKVEAMVAAMDGKASSEELIALGEEVKDLIEQVNGVEADVEAVKSQLQTEIASLEQARKDLEAKLTAAIEDKADASVVDGLKEEISGLNSRLETAEAKLLAAENSIEDLQSSNEGLTDKYNTLDEKIKSLETSLSTSINEAKSDIETAKNDIVENTNEIIALKEKLSSTASQTEINEIKAEIEKQEEALNNHIAAYNEAIKGFASSSALNELKEQFEALGVEGNLNDIFFSKEDAAELANQISNAATKDELTQLSELLNGELANKLNASDFNTFKEYAEGKLEDLQNQINLNYNAINAIKGENYAGETIADLAEKIAVLESIIGNGLEGDLNETVLGKIKAIADELGETSESLELFKTHVSDTYQTKLGESQINALENLTTVLNGESLKTYLDKIAELEAALSMTDEEGNPTNIILVEQLSKEIDSIQDEISSLKNMIQSIVYIPKYKLDNNAVVEDYTTFNTLRLYKPTYPYGYVTLAQNNESTIEFKVSPASAAKDFDKKYDVVFCGTGQAITRNDVQNDLMKVVSCSGDEATGIVTIKVSTNTPVTDTKYYSLNAKVTPKADNEDVEKNTNILSNYFIIKNEVEAYTSVKATSSINTTEVEFTTPTVLDYAEGREFFGVNGSTEKRIDDRYNLTFDVEYSLTTTNIPGNPTTNEFSLYESVLTIGNGHLNAASVGKTATVSSSVTVSNNNGTSVTYNNSNTYRTVSIVNVDLAKEFNFNTSWKKTDTTISLNPSQINEIVSGSGLSTAGFWALDFSNYATAPSNPNGPYVLISSSNKTIQVVIPAGTNIDTDKTIKAEINITNSQKYTISFNLKPMTYPTLPGLTFDNDVVVNGIVTIRPTITKNSSGDYTSWEAKVNLGTIYSNLSNIKNSYTTTTGQGIQYDYNNYYMNITSDVISINKNTYDGSDLAVTAYGLFGSKVSKDEGSKFNIEVVDIFGGKWMKIDNDKSLSYNITSKNETVNVFQNLKWEDLDGNVMWSEGSENTLSKASLAFYGLSEPTVSIIEGANNNLYTLSSDGVLSLTDEGKRVAINKTVKFRISLQHPWGDKGTIEGGKNNLDVTVNINTNGVD